MYIGCNKLQDVYFTTKNGDKTLGGIVSTENGNIIFLPKIDFDREEFYEDEEEDTWNEKELQKGIAFKNCIAALDKAIRNEVEKSVKPDWINKSEFNIKSAEVIKQKKIKHEEEIQKRKEK